jgi:hypothetical protein
MALYKRSFAAIQLSMATQSFGTSMVGDYKQCGGSGGDCKEFCNDAPWPNHKCSSSNARCDRLGALHWQCQPGSNGGSSNNNTVANWQQQRRERTIANSRSRIELRIGSVK